MTNFKIIFATCAASLALASTAVAGKSAATANLPDKVAQMHCMVGNWQGAASITMGGQTAELELSMDCKATSGGHAITCKSRFSGAGMLHEETDLFGWDPETDTYHWYSVTNAGDAHDHVAKPPKGPTLTWVYKGKKDGKPFVEKIAMTFNKDASQIRLANTGTIGGQVAFTMKGSVRKR